MKRAAGVMALMVLITASFVTADAQTRRKPKARPLATPVSTLTGAEIISQAGDNSDPSTQVQPQPTETPRRTTTSTRLSDLDGRVKRLEGGKSPAAEDAKERHMLLNLEILDRAEQRVDNLRKQSFDMMEKESALRKRLDEIAYEIQPEVIERVLQLGGSLRPEEVRENRRKQLAAEQVNVQAMLTQVQTTRASLDSQLAKATDMVEKLRAKLEKDIDDSFLKDEPPTDKPNEDQP
ncbi:MAG TPA: hypothetical protein VL501_07110 [Pyrinomonadaceae bacterium]|nr:hypothetical protein [Pyrinomonadaceae bacterium]